jgi:hypothetical protein
MLNGPAKKATYLPSKAVEIHGGEEGAVIGLLDAIDKKGNPN